MSVRGLGWIDDSWSYMVLKLLPLMQSVEEPISSKKLYIMNPNLAMIFKVLKLGFKVWFSCWKGFNLSFSKGDGHILYRTTEICISLSRCMSVLSFNISCFWLWPSNLSWKANLIKLKLPDMGRKLDIPGNLRNKYKNQYLVLDPQIEILNLLKEDNGC